jgi:hypothetical protein
MYHTMVHCQKPSPIAPNRSLPSDHQDLQLRRITGIQSTMMHQRDVMKPGKICDRPTLVLAPFAQQGHAADRANSPGRSQRYPHSVQQSQENAYRSEQAPEHRLPGVNKSAPDDHIAQLLPSLGPINTNQLPRSSSSHALQPPHSATSVERPPSLVSDHNSTYSISPKTWPSPRPEVPARLVTSRYHWHESSPADRRGSAPAISHLVSLPFTGDEGYVSAAPPSASSEPKYLLPTPVGRPTSFDGQYTNIHRHSASNPNISLSPMIGPNRKLKDSSNVRDARMNFSSLLN